MSPPLLAAVLLVAGLALQGGPAGTPVPESSLQAIRIVETPCYGHCPHYMITVTPDDRYVLDGYLDTRHPGRSSGQLETGSFSRMAAIVMRETAEPLASDINPDNAVTCPQWVTDSPGYRLVLARSDGFTRVSWYRGCSGHPDTARMERISDELRALYGYDRLIAIER